MIAKIATAAVYHLFVVGDAFAGRMRRLRGRHLIDYAVLALVTMTHRTAGCSKRRRWIASLSSMSTPRSYEFIFNSYPGTMPP